MAGKKRKSDEMSMLNRPQLLSSIKNVDNIRDRALAAFIYLSGARISEIVGTKKTMTFYKGKGKDRILERQETIIIDPLKKENIEFIYDKDILLIHQVVCLKRKYNIPKRTIPVILSKEKEFVNIFIEHYNTLQAGESLFDITRQRAWQIINKEMGLYNHFLIHERTTHLVTNQNFTDLHLKQFRGWSDTRPASIYTHLNWHDLADKMR